VYNATRRPLRSRILRWYARAARDLPWRRTRDPYAIWVSEVMLQQTQVARVAPAYESFLRRFPTVASLARARLASVLRAWAGLGYNRRALNLHRAARLAGGSLPSDAQALRALPGIGRYTASAVACFATGAPEAFADTNIRRVLGRIALGRVATLDEAVAIDAALLPPRAADRWHHALMDLGAMLCLSRHPRCGECPVREVCAGRGTAGEPAGRRQSAFATSDRKVRGEIVRALRGARGGLSERALAAAIGDPRVHALARTLEQEGLLSRRGSRLVLG